VIKAARRNPIVAPSPADMLAGPINQPFPGAYPDGGYTVRILSGCTFWLPEAMPQNQYGFGNQQGSVGLTIASLNGPFASDYIDLSTFSFYASLAASNAVYVGKTYTFALATLVGQAFSLGFGFTPDDPDAAQVILTPYVLELML